MGASNPNNSKQKTCDAPWVRLRHHVARALDRRVRELVIRHRIPSHLCVTVRGVLVVSGAVLWCWGVLLCRALFVVLAARSRAQDRCSGISVCADCGRCCAIGPRESPAPAATAAVTAAPVSHHCCLECTCSRRRGDAGSGFEEALCETSAGSNRWSACFPK